MTLKDIAKETHISVSTVSKAISNSKDVSPETRKVVLEAAERLGYFNKKKKVKLENKSKKNFIVAIICPEIISMAYSVIVTKLSERLTDIGGKSIIYVSGFEREYINSVVSQCDNDDKIDYIISMVNCKKTKCTPLVYFWNSEMASPEYSTSVTAVQYLRKMGFSKIGFAGETNTVQEEQMFVDANGDDSFVFRAEARFEKIGELAAEYYVHGKMPEAVVCAYDEVAFGLIGRFRELGVEVPGDVSVIGRNNIKASSYAYGGITTVEKDHEKNIEEIIRFIKNRKGELTFSPKNKTELRIVERGTVLLKNKW